LLGDRLIVHGIDVEGFEEPRDLESVHQRLDVITWVKSSRFDFLEAKFRCNPTNYSVVGDAFSENDYGANPQVEFGLNLRRT